MVYYRKGTKVAATSSSDAGGGSSFYEISEIGERSFNGSVRSSVGTNPTPGINTTWTGGRPVAVDEKFVVQNKSLPCFLKIEH